MKKFIPSMTQLIQGVIITAVGLFIIKMLPARAKTFIMG